MTKRPTTKARNGFALAIVMGVGVLVLFIAFFIHSLSRAEIRLTSGFVDHQVAFHLAEAGLEQALYALKTDLGTNRGLLAAIEGETPTEIDFGRGISAELESLVESPALGDVFLWARYDPEPNNGATIGDYRIGRLTVRSQGIYTNAQGYQARRQVKMVTKVTGINLGIVAPDHGLMVRDQVPTLFRVGNDRFDIRDLKVLGGNIYFENGLDAEVPEHLLNEFRTRKLAGFFDLGYGDLLHIGTWFNGGLELVAAREQHPGDPDWSLVDRYNIYKRQVEYKNNGIIQRFKKFQGIRNILRGGKAYREESIAMPNTRPRPQGYTNQDINLFRAEEYRKVADLVINPVGTYERDGDPDDNRYFQDVFFRGPLDTRNTFYRNVLPLYGWGDWRKVPARWTANPNRKQDISNAIHLDGVTYVHGDVYLEGWYEGIGTLVVEGNVYVGGDVVSLPAQTTGYNSLANLVVLEDRAREPYGTADPFADRVSGRVIYKPHHDMDFDRRRSQILRDTDPQLDLAIYAQNGMIVDKTSIFDDFFDMTLEYNFSTERFNVKDMPHDLEIYGSDPKLILQGMAGRRGNAVFYNPQISSEILSWEEETPST